MTAPKKARSRGDGRSFSGANGARGTLHAESEATNSSGKRKGWQDVRLPRNWRERLPLPVAYYPTRLELLTRANPSGWAQARCPFHEDGTASLSVQMNDQRGGWRCFAGCGAGDLVAFHMRATGKGFRDAVLDLVRGGA
ncbi:CHC2 zinc finger domain-containing protein [Arenimonas donghaensis]|uniref:CHC2 zinc finger domain-containing protein n=1 Tax=Arenimonas donghaensis TaxID=375061 RepID=UPI0009FFB631|nr:CHC2 zinc finger domain-containing protein [Arenimonas donghaensis]